MNAALALVTAATQTGPAAREAARSWLAASDLERLPPQQYPLLPLAVPAIEQASPDHPWLPRLRGVYRRAWYANQLIVRAAGRLIQALAGAGIPVLLADAVPLALTVYGDRLRPIGVLALLTPLNRGADAASVLAGQGWRDAAPASAPPGSTPWAVSRRFCSMPGMFADLCWRAAPFWPSEALDAATWSRAQPITVASRPAHALSAADQLARSSWAATLPGPAALSALADVAALLAGGRVDWDAAVEVAALCHIGRTLLAVLEQVEAATGIAAPDGARAALAALPRSPFEARAGRRQIPAMAAPGRAQALAAAYAQYRLSNSAVTCPGKQAQALAAAYAQYRRMAAAQGLTPPPWAFLTYLQHRWGCASRRELLRRAAARLIRG